MNEIEHFAGVVPANDTLHVIVGISLYALFD